MCSLRSLSKGTDVVQSIEDLYSSLQGTENGNAKVYYEQVRVGDGN